MNDPTETVRRTMIETGQPYADLAQAIFHCGRCGGRLETTEVKDVLVHADSEPDHDPMPGPTWTTDELTRDFEVKGFMAPFVVVRRKSDGKVGSLQFTHRPRVYFGWEPDDG